MSLSTLELTTVNRGIVMAKKILDLQSELYQLNVIYDSASGVKYTITQEELDERPEYSGLTKAQLDDGMYALTTIIKTDIQNSLTQLTELAARASL